MKINYKTLIAATGLLAAAAVAQDIDRATNTATDTPGDRQGGQTAAADNTARNTRDRNDATKTPFDQGSSKADTETTARIRKDILAKDGLSVNARNVKIVTANGVVTLRGPVNTEEEKRIVGEIAGRAAPQANVENQLEVK